MAGFGVLAFLIMLVHVAVVIGCAMAIADANRRLEHQGRKPEMLSPILWVLASLVGGILTVALYWGMHFSTLSRTGWSDGEQAV